MVKDVEFVRLHLGPLSRSLQESARQWVESLGKLMKDTVEEGMNQLNTELEVRAQALHALLILANSQELSSNLKRPPNTLEDLKFVLSTIAQIRAMSLEVEMRCRDIVERYRTLAMYKIDVTEEEEKLQSSISQKWTDVFQEAKMVDRSLVKVKKKFTLVSSLLLLC